MLIEVTKITPLLIICLFSGTLLGATVMALCNISSTYSREIEEELFLNNEKIIIKYFTDKIDKLIYIDCKSDWIVLRAAEDMKIKACTFAMIPLGVAMKLPEGYEAHIAPRSSTFKNFGVIQTNSVAVIDNSYCGDNDQWKYPVYAMRDTEIHVNDRICQFRIIRNQPTIEFEEVDHLDGKDRGGFGSTGV